MLPIQNVTYTKSYLYQMLPRQSVLDKMLLYENVLYKMLLIRQKLINSDSGRNPSILYCRGYVYSLYKRRRCKE